MLQQPAFSPFRRTFRLRLPELPTLLLGLAASLPWALLILLAAGLVYAGTARAQETAPETVQESVTCDGVSLVDRLSATAPEKLAGARTQAAATANGQGLLWKIEKEGRDPSWLFGTMHVTDPRVTELPDAAQAAFDAAETVVIETIDILDPVKAQAALLTNPELTMFTDGSTLTSRLSQEDASLVEAELSRRSIPLALVSRMKPWMIAGMVAMPACELARKADGVEFLDIRIASSAKAEGKQLLGLESIGEQMTAMADLPIEFHMRGLVETIRLSDLMPDIMATMTELYLEGEIALIMPVILAAGPEATDGDAADDLDGYAEFEERIVTLRNHVMAGRAGPILEKGNAFIAVGALHLPGDEGLVSLLRDDGYTLTAVR